jgi:hypothetical protein
MIACNEERVETVFQNSNNSIKQSTPDRILTDNDINDISNFHNHHMISIINSYDYNCAAHNEEMENQFDLLFTNMGLSQTEISNFITDPALNYNYIVTNVADDDVERIINETHDFVTINPNCNYQDIVNFVSNKETDARANIVGSDLDICLIFLKTFEKSCQLWMSTSQGGLGYGDIFIDNLGGDYIPPAAINWNLIAWADGAGAARALFFCWKAAGFGPIGWGAALWAMGGAAAYASGATLIGQLLLT